ncbi:MAG: MFS transporter [Actinomycetota bacterium]
MPSIVGLLDTMPATAGTKVRDSEAMDALARNLQAYPTHQRVAGALFWMPVVVLYLIDEVGLARALQIQAVYYVAVVVLEVPSGWMSDRVGRVVTMRVAAAAWVGAHALFLLGGTPALVVAQVLLATGYAFLSGTDVTLHFDTLEALGRADEFDDREARSRQGLLMVTAVTALLGGVLAVGDLRLPFVAALVAAVVQLGLTARLVEPPRGDAATVGFRRDLVATVGHVRDPLLGWLAFYVATQVVVVHLAAEFTGPYLLDVLDRPVDDPAEGAILVGVVAAVVALVGSIGVRAVPGVVRRLGLRSTLVIAALVPVGVLVAMAATTAIWVVPILAFRGVQGAATSVLAPSVVGGRIEQHHRATFLSITSLGGRLTHTVVLLAISGAAADSIGDALTMAAVVAIGAWILTTLTRPLVRDFPRGLGHAHDHEHPAETHDHLHVHGDGHHDHDHDPPVAGAHRHEHVHAPVRHTHRHTRDVHHGHDHG